MSHRNYDEWRLYIEDQLDEQTREAYETHLYTCDECLDIYVMALESPEIQLPSPTENLTSTIMEAIQKDKQEETIKKVQPSKRTSQRQTIFHYVLAAAMTLVLMSTGVFSQMMDMSESIEKQESPSSESKIISFFNKQESFTSKIQQQLKEGDHHE